MRRPTTTYRRRAGGARRAVHALSGRWRSRHDDQKARAAAERADGCPADPPPCCRRSADRDRRPGSAPACPRGSPAHVTSTPRHVLIVEDEGLVALSLEAMVQNLGHVVTGITVSPHDAVALAASTSPQVVLMDVRLGPAGDEGIATAAAIHARVGSAILFVTAYADASMVERIQAALPAATVLAKPVRAVELAKAIEEALRGS
ncbi:MAG TPA: response regulator [Geminicoccaceae bacterium]|nr:response regulator [Geminicoccaceae bacterium]